MLKKKITYTDYNGVERTEEHYFGLSKAEVLEMEISTTNGFSNMIQKIIDSKNPQQIVNTFKKLVLQAYGEKSDDGKYFLKEDENGRPLSAKFKQTEAYSVLFMELATDANAGAEFVNGILPENM